MQPTIDRIAIYLLNEGLQANTRYTVLEGPAGLTHTTGNQEPQGEAFRELVSFTTDDDPPQSLFDMRFVLTYETDGWAHQVNTKNGPAIIEFSKGPGRRIK